MENANLSNTTLKWLNDAARWARFISILGFVFIGFMIVVSIFVGPILSILNDEMDISGLMAQSGTVIAAIYIAIAAIYFFPIYYLFKFSNGFIKAYKVQDEEHLNTSFLFLKKHFKFIGILMIVVLAGYLVLFMIGIGAAIVG